MHATQDEGDAALRRSRVDQAMLDLYTRECLNVRPAHKEKPADTNLTLWTPAKTTPGMRAGMVLSEEKSASVGLHDSSSTRPCSFEER